MVFKSRIQTKELDVKKIAVMANISRDLSSFRTC